MNTYYIHIATPLVSYKGKQAYSIQTHLLRFIDIIILLTRTSVFRVKPVTFSENFRQTGNSVKDVYFS